jgi:hypothetical protein
VAKRLEAEGRGKSCHFKRRKEIVGVLCDRSAEGPPCSQGEDEEDS